MLKENLANVEANICTACRKVKRERSEVTLIAVSKTKPVEMLQKVYDCGIRDFGENKAQEICDKYDKLPSDIRWHMIGHLQRNKVKNIIDKVCMIHSLDSYRLAEEVCHLNNIQVRGLMSVAPFVDNPEDNRQYFQQLKQLAVDIDAKNMDNISMEILSMGMTGDYLTAIEEGATLVRVGTGIFGERYYGKNTQ